MKIKFLTLNIFNGSYLENCIDFLKTEKADVFVLQEVYNGPQEADKKHRAYEVIKLAFGDFHSYYSAEYYKNINGLKIDSGKAIFSRFPVVKQESTFFIGEYRERKSENAEEFVNCGRSLQYVQLNAEGAELNIFNIHGIWGFDGKDTPARLEMSRVVRQETGKCSGVILAGDFNLTPETQTIKNIEKDLINVFAGRLISTFNLKIKELGMKSGKYSWKAKDLKGFAVSVVDMVFISPEFKISKSEQPKPDVSDHYPLSVELEV